MGIESRCILVRYHQMDPEESMQQMRLTGFTVIVCFMQRTAC